MSPSKSLHQQYDKVCKETSIFDSKYEVEIPKVDENCLLLGRVLGRGGFSAVSEIRSILLPQNETSDAKLQFMAKNCIRDGDARYAFKKLTLDKTDINTYEGGLLDLALESKFLAVIDHPHIIKLRACSLANPIDDNFFVILDRLYNTLEKEIFLWKKQKNDNSLLKLFDRKGKRQKKFLVKRLTVAYGITSAMSLLHERRIIYRDLAADNIGFDVRGEVKIFDFGLAKELNPSLQLQDGNYKLTGFTGSLRYMAPEVVNSIPYNLSADVFSFGVILWVITSCSIPYQGWTVKMYKEKVAGKGLRPTINESWRKEISNLI